MRQNELGRSGLTVSAVGLGCNNFGRRLDRTGTRAVIDAALDAGITFFDTADIYGGDGASERMIGELLATSLRAYGVIGVAVFVTPNRLNFGRPDEIISSMNQVAEGVKASSVIMEFADKYGINMPIAREVDGVINHGSTVEDAYRGLVAEKPGHEVHGSGF